MTSSAAMAASNPPLDLLPGQAGCRIVAEIGFAPFQLLDLPVVDRDVLGSRRQVVPEIFDELQLLRGAEVEDRFARPIHVSSPPGSRGVVPARTMSWHRGLASIQHTRPARPRLGRLRSGDYVPNQSNP